MVYELIAYSTENYQDIRYRRYTTSKKKAEAFNKIPKIQFTDSGHGIVFDTNEHRGKRKTIISILYEYVNKYI